VVHGLIFGTPKSVGRQLYCKTTESVGNISVMIFAVLEVSYVLQLVYINCVLY
jgi:hypothetical protein